MTAASTYCQIARRCAVLLIAAIVLTSCGTWRGVANVPLPGGPGSEPDHYTIHVQMPDVLALNVNSRVRVADVYVGTVRAIDVKNWIATLTLDLQSSIKLPKNATARIGQTSLLGTQHIELAPPQDPSPELLHNGDTIPLRNSAAFPTIERTLASIGTVLHGGGISNLESITTEVNNILEGNAEPIRAFLGKLDVFIAQLNEQRQSLTRAIDSTNQLLTIAVKRDQTLNRILTEFPPLIQHFADRQNTIAETVEALGRFSKVTNESFSQSRANFEQNLKLLQRPLKQLGIAAPDLPTALKIMLTVPFPIDAVPKIVRGDYINVSPTIDLTLSAVDNGFLTGTGFSGALRALEQSWGRDPATMIPDVRYTPNPADVPPERGQ
jgi:phospholipid/cholesterol/gamma-HCH transport system substrate-binding protein